MRVILFALALLAIPGLALADWKEISHKDSGVSFGAPGFHASDAWFDQGPYGDNWSVGYGWASFYYGRSVPGGTMVVPRRPRDNLEQWPTFAHEMSAVTWGQEGSAGGPHGSMDYQKFEYDGRECVVFAHGWGVQRSARPYNKPNLLFGFICDPSRGSVTDEQIMEWFSQIKIEK